MGGVFGLLPRVHSEDDGRYTGFVWSRSKRFDPGSAIGVVGGHDDLQFVTDAEMHQRIAHEHVLDSDRCERLQRVGVWHIHAVHPQPGPEVRCETRLLTPYLRPSYHEVLSFSIDQILPVRVSRETPCEPSTWSRMITWPTSASRMRCVFVLEACSQLVGPLMPR